MQTRSLRTVCELNSRPTVACSLQSVGQSLKSKVCVWNPKVSSPKASKPKVSTPKRFETKAWTPKRFDGASSCAPQCLYQCQPVPASRSRIICTNVGLNKRGKRTARERRRFDDRLIKHRGLGVLVCEEQAASSAVRVPFERLPSGFNKQHRLAKRPPKKKQSEERKRVTLR